MFFSFSRSTRERQPPSTSTGIRAPARLATFPAFPAETAIATRSSTPAESASHPVRFQRSVHCLFVDCQLSTQGFIAFSTVEAKGVRKFFANASVMGFEVDLNERASGAMADLSIGSKTALAARIADVSPLATTDFPLI